MLCSCVSEITFGRLFELGDHLIAQTCNARRLFAIKSTHPPISNSACENLPAWGRRMVSFSKLHDFISSEAISPLSRIICIDNKSVIVFNIASDFCYEIGI